MATEVLKPSALQTGGYEFSGECRDIDWCLNTSPCGDHGVCVDGHLNYTCDCDAGFDAVSISNGEKCDEINECDGDGSCSPGTCNNLINNFSCSCPTGHKFGAGEHGETCEVEVCGEAPAVEHSTRNDTSPIVFGKAVEYHCDTGHSVDGKVGGMSNWVTTCLANGTFFQKFFVQANFSHTAQH